MKIIGALAITFVSAQVETTTMWTTTTYPHSQEAQQFCHNACKGTEDQLANGNCDDGLYPNPQDCTSFFVCWDEGIVELF